MSLGDGFRDTGSARQPDALIALTSNSDAPSDEDGIDRFRRFRRDQ